MFGTLNLGPVTVEVAPAHAEMVTLSFREAGETACSRDFGCICALGSLQRGSPEHAGGTRIQTANRPEG